MSFLRKQDGDPSDEEPVASPKVAGFGKILIIQKRENALPGRENEVVLTFDDGPTRIHNTTARILDVLAERQVKAAFCVVGRHVEANPNLTRRIYEEGHLLVNHTQEHRLLWLRRKAVITEEIDRCDAAIAEAIGVPAFQCRAFRPPAGVITKALRETLDERGVALIPITYFSYDTLYGPDNFSTIVERTLKNARLHRGGVYVLHDLRFRSWSEAPGLENDSRSGANRAWVPQATAEIIDTLRGDGFRFPNPAEVFLPEEADKESTTPAGLDKIQLRQTA